MSEDIIRLNAWRDFNDASGNGDVLEFDRIDSERILTEEAEVRPLATGN